MPSPEYPPLGKFYSCPLKTRYLNLSSPAPTTPVPVDLNDDGKLEVLVSFNDGHFNAYGSDSAFKWSVDIAHGKDIAFCSEPTVADLNQDGVPEIIIATYGSPDVADSGYLMVISSTGEVLADILLENASKSPR